MERYKFTDNRTLVYADGEDLVGMTPGRDGTSKSMLVANYFDIPLELRFSTNPEDPVRSFRASIGGRVGVLYSSFTKVKYKEEGEMKKFKDRQNWNLEKIRYGVFAKVGVGNFSVFGYYNLTPVFQKDKGPSGTDMSNLTIGISLSSF
ncbi:MAG: PorT family protein [Bacteroidia bacterium]|nr:PorT family protein [Bacteroidia bacterium]